MSYLRDRVGVRGLLVRSIYIFYASCNGFVIFLLTNVEITIPISSTNISVTPVSV